MAEANASTLPTSNHLLVVAFDFGTTYSGYALSFRDEPLKIQTNQNWIAGSEKLVSLKTPTCVLLSPNRKFHSFGYEAENKYSELAFDDKHSDWLLFRRFKMILYQPGELKRDVEIKDINGTPMPAKTIFAMSIRFLQQHFLDLLNRQFTGIKETDVQYVLTVPAIWDDSAKQFMREAAIEAGIETSRLRLALESEAASVWCHALTEDSMMPLTECGTQCMVVDLGGGTVDVSVHGINSDGTLDELHKASGGPWGGTVVDNNYISWLSEMFGQGAVDRFKAEDMASFFDLLREWETNKRSVRFDATEPIMLRISATLKEISQEEDGGQFSSRLASQNVVIKRDKMKIDPAVVRHWFDGPLNSIITHIKRILLEPNMEHLGTILLVGGFAESKYVQQKIRNAINYKTFNVPNETGLTVLKGAVRFGHDPKLISTRIMNYTYGIRMTRDLYNQEQPYFWKNNTNQGRKIHFFTKFVSAGESVKVGHTVGICGTPNNMNKSVVRVFCSSDPNPRLTAEPGCKLLGTLIVEHPEGDTLEDKSVVIVITFGDTELKVKATVIKTNKEFHTTIDCLK